MGKIASAFIFGIVFFFGGVFIGALTKDTIIGSIIAVIFGIAGLVIGYRNDSFADITTRFWHTSAENRAARRQQKREDDNYYEQIRKEESARERGRLDAQRRHHNRYGAPPSQTRVVVVGRRGDDGEGHVNMPDDWMLSEKRKR